MTTESEVGINNEDKRQWVHLGAVVFAFLIPWLTKWQTVGLAGLAVLFNLFLLPRLVPDIFREAEKAKRYITGIVLYPVTVLIIVLLCPWPHKEVAAGSWAILACGDSFSNIIGRRFSRWKLIWNRKKSYIGLIAFIVFAYAGCVILVYWVKPELDLTLITKASFWAVVIAGLVESLDIPIDDNVTVGIASGLILYFNLA